MGDAYWEYALEDSLDLVAKIPVIAANIYHHTFGDGVGPAYDSSLDWAGNYAQMLGTSTDPKSRKPLVCISCSMPIMKVEMCQLTPLIWWALPSVTLTTLMLQHSVALPDRSTAWQIRSA